MENAKFNKYFWSRIYIFLDRSFVLRLICYIQNAQYILYLSQGLFRYLGEDRFLGNLSNVIL